MGLSGTHRSLCKNRTPAVAVVIQHMTQKTSGLVQACTETSEAAIMEPGTFKRPAAIWVGHSALCWRPWMHYFKPLLEYPHNRHECALPSALRLGTGTLPI